MNGRNFGGHRVQAMAPSEVGLSQNLLPRVPTWQQHSSFSTPQSLSQTRHRLHLISDGHLPAPCAALSAQPHA